VFIFNDRYPVGLAIEHLLLIEDCSEHSEWHGKVVFLPL